MTKLRCPIELRGCAFSRIDGIERFWSSHGGRLVGWSPSHKPIELVLDAHGSLAGIAMGGNHVAVLVEWKVGGKRARQIVVADARDGRLVASRGWSGAGAVPGVVISKSGQTIAHGDGRSLFVWRIDQPNEEGVSKHRGTPRWVDDEMDCLVDDGSWWRFHSLAHDERRDLKLSKVSRDTSWTIAPDLSVATSREGHRALITRVGNDIVADLHECPGVLAPGPNGCVGAIKNQKLYVIDRGGQRVVLGQEPEASWRTLAFSSDGEKLAVIHSGQIEIHPVPRVA